MKGEWTMGLAQIDPHDRHERAARNQSLFREVNEKIESVSQDASSMFLEFSCECADTECFENVSLTLEEYEYVRRIPTHFFVKPGHVYRDVERVVETDGHGDRFEVVEKFGDAGTLAVRLDPRSPP
jgi:hypothetical protein